MMRTKKTPPPILIQTLKGTMIPATVLIALLSKPSIISECNAGSGRPAQPWQTSKKAQKEGWKQKGRNGTSKCALL